MHTTDHSCKNIITATWLWVKYKYFSSWHYKNIVTLSQLWPHSVESYHVISSLLFHSSKIIAVSIQGKQLIQGNSCGKSCLATCKSGFVSQQQTSTYYQLLQQARYKYLFFFFFFPQKGEVKLSQCYMQKLPLYQLSQQVIFWGHI